MGDPKFSRRRYVTPSHPWQGERIIREKELTRKYGLKNKTELWKVQSLIRHFRKRARDLQALVRYEDPQAEKEMHELLKRLNKMGLLGDEATLDDVLVLEAENLLGRRLQTMAYLKGLSYSHKHARQLIVHGHIAIDGKRVTVPGYLVKRTEEDVIDYLAKSPLANELHPARPKDEVDEGLDGILGPEPKTPEAGAPETDAKPEADVKPSEKNKEEAKPEPAEGPKEEAKAKKEEPEPKDEATPEPDQKAESKDEPPVEPKADEKPAEGKKEAESPAKDEDAPPEEKKEDEK